MNLEKVRDLAEKLLDELTKQDGYKAAVNEMLVERNKKIQGRTATFEEIRGWNASIDTNYKAMIAASENLNKASQALSKALQE